MGREFQLRRRSRLGRGSGGRTRVCRLQAPARVFLSPRANGEVPHAGPPVEKPLLKQEQAALPRQDPGVVRSARASTSRPERSHAATPL